MLLKQMPKYMREQATSGGEALDHTVSQLRVFGIWCFYNKVYYSL